MKSVILCVILFCIPSIAALSFNPGYQYENYIQPGNPSDCEAPSGSRCWYVDADAPEGGDGTFENPYNSFETVVGCILGDSYRAGLIGPGDYLYVKGVFKASEEIVDCGKSTSIIFGRAHQGGTPIHPTTIKSYLGTRAAIFDGENMKGDLIRVYALTSLFGGLKIENIEVVRAKARGIIISEHVAYADINNIIVHHTQGDGCLGTGGGILLRMTDGPHNYTIRNSLFYSNNQDQVCGNNNIGGLSILSEGWAQNGSTISIYNNVLYDEVHAIRHKHSGNIVMNAYNNLIFNSDIGLDGSSSAFFIRAFKGNNIYNNIVFDISTGFIIDTENQQGDMNVNISHNTLYGSNRLVTIESNEQTFKKNITLANNVYQNLNRSKEIIIIGRWSSANYNISEWLVHNNIYYFNNSQGLVFLYHNFVGYNYAHALTHLADSTSMFGNPLFVDAINHDFRLAASSLARNGASDGSDIGALQYGDENPVQNLILEGVDVTELENSGSEIPVCQATNNGRCYYIAPNGDNAGDASFEQPHKDAEFAISNAGPGDMIYFRGGTYGTENTYIVSNYRRDVDSADDCDEFEQYIQEDCIQDAYSFGYVRDWSGWATSSDGYEVNSGTAQHPITIKAYPGETPYFDVMSEYNGIYPERGIGDFRINNRLVTLSAFYFFQENYWVIDGLKIRGQIINMGGGNTPERNTHDITIKNSEVFDVGTYGNFNPGLIRVDRAVDGGAYNIFIYNNTLHDIWDSRVGGDYMTTTDHQHYGGVTTLSNEYYSGYDLGSTGYIEIINNTMYNLPEVFFFKNPNKGPILIEGNKIWNSRNLGAWSGSNITFRNNLVYDVGALGRVYAWCYWDDERMEHHAGDNWRIIGNTFANINTGLTNTCGYSAIIRDNIFQGMASEMSRAPWNWYEPVAYHVGRNSDESNAVEDSDAYDWDVDNNCFIQEGSDSLFLRRRWQEEGENSWTTENYNLTGMRSVWGFDINSYVEHNSYAESIFVNPENYDFTVITSHPCEGLGSSLVYDSSQPESFLPGDVNHDGVVDCDDVLLAETLEQLVLVGRNWLE